MGPITLMAPFASVLPFYYHMAPFHSSEAPFRSGSSGLSAPAPPVYQFTVMVLVRVRNRVSNFHLKVMAAGLGKPRFFRKSLSVFRFLVFFRF